MITEFKFQNGDEVEDIVSGIKGIIDCCSIWLNGCKRYSIQPKAKRGEVDKRPESWWTDEAQIRKISDGLNKKVEPKDTGGPSFKSSSARF